MSTGRLAFDSSVVPTTGTGIEQQNIGLKYLTRLTDRQNGVVFDLADANAFELDFNNFVLTGIGIGGSVNTLEAVANKTDDFLAAPNGVCYYATPSSATSDCSVSFVKSNPVIRTVDFTTTMTSGSLIGQVSHGSFAFDYKLGNTSFTTATAAPTELDFVNGQLTGFPMGGRASLNSLPVGTNNFLFSQLSYNQTCAYIQTTDTAPGGCTLAFNELPLPPVPEPGALPLLGCGVLLAAAARRSRFGVRARLGVAGVRATS